MKNVFSRVAAIAALVVCAGAAQADVIDFELPVTTQFFPPYLLHEESFTQGEYSFQTLSNADITSPFDLVGAIIDGSTLGICAPGTCPVNNFTTFYGALNDAFLVLDRVDGLDFYLNSFDASFMGPTTGLPSVLGLQLIGILADGSAMDQAYELGGLDAFGQFNFDLYTTGVFGQQKFKTVLAYGFTCSDVSCSAFDRNAGFALDNINVTAVPEPETYALMLVGLAALGAAARRRRAA